jgi:hypothetical protein
MRKTTITVQERHATAYQVFRRERPDLSLTDFYAECADFRLRHGDEASLKPAIKAQHELLQKLDASIRAFSQPPPAIDHTRLELHTKRLAEQVSTAVQHLEQGVNTAAIHALAAYRTTVWRVAIGAFALGALVGMGGLSLSRILW